MGACTMNILPYPMVALHLYTSLSTHRPHHFPMSQRICLLDLLVNLRSIIGRSMRSIIGRSMRSIIGRSIRSIIGRSIIGRSIRSIIANHFPISIHYWQTLGPPLSPIIWLRNPNHQLVGGLSRLSRYNPTIYPLIN